MIEQLPAAAAAHAPLSIEPFDWLGRVLAHFATAERAIGQLCLALDLPVEKGALSSLQSLCARMERTSNRRCLALCKRIERWRSLRPLRHLLAHASITVLHDAAGHRFILTRNLPLDRNDITPDRLWTEDECRDLLRVVTSDSRSIADQIGNLLKDYALLSELRKPDPGSTAG